jgi:hypothetical protein
MVAMESLSSIEGLTRKILYTEDFANFLQAIAGDGNAAVGLPKYPVGFGFKCQYVTEAPLCFSA